MHDKAVADSPLLLVPKLGSDWRTLEEPPGVNEESPLNAQASAEEMESKLRPLSFGGAGPGTTSFLQGASHFGIKQANMNQHIDNLKVITTINHFCSRRSAGDNGLGPQSISLEASRTTSCACGTSSSQVIRTRLNTPSHQVHFEFNQRELREVALSHRETQVQQRELDLVKLELALREVSLERRELAIFAKEQAIEGPTASADLIAVFGVEGSKGIVHVLQDFALFQTEPDARRGRFLKLHVRFVPHYGGSSKLDVMRLNDAVKVTIANVVKNLHATQRNSHRPLAFEAIRAALAQLVFLEPRPEHNTILRRTIKITESVPLPAFLTQSQWMVKLIDSDTPESVLDSEVVPSLPKRSRKRRGCKIILEDRVHTWDQGRVDLIDLAVLTFPRRDVPRFKLSHLRLRWIAVKKPKISSQRKADVILEYKTHTYGLPDGIVLKLSPEARCRDCAYTHALFA